MSYMKMDEKMEKPFRHYITVWKDEHLLPDRKMAKSSTPKISIIIPMYNEEKNITPCIRSIQNQSEQEIEIVCVNDNSTDKTLSILEKLQKEDPRIEIITNKSNRGVIYNRIYGALQSKGEYVTFIDADDGFCNIDILNKAYNVATKEHGEKIDIVHYQTCACTIKDNGEMDPFVIFFTFNPNNFDKVIKQPEISDNYMQKKKNVTGSGLVFDKIYSRDLIKRVADYIGPQIWNQNLVFVDDFLLCFACMKMAKSIVNIGEIGYWHYMDQTTSVTSKVWQIDGDRLKYPEKTNKKIGDYMIVLNRILQLTDNEPGTLEFREDIIKGLLKEEYLLAFARSIHYDTLLRLFEKLYNWKYTDAEAKKRIQNYIRKILKYKIEPRRKFAHLLNLK